MDSSIKLGGREESTFMQIQVHRRGVNRTAGTATAMGLWLEISAGVRARKVRGTRFWPPGRLERGRFPARRFPGGAGGGPEREGWEEEPIRTRLFRAGWGRGRAGRGLRLGLRGRGAADSEC